MLDLTYTFYLQRILINSLNAALKGNLRTTPYYNILKLRTDMTEMNA